MADDTEWEPIETHSSAVEPIRSPATVSMQELSVSEWPELLTKMTALGSMAPFEVPYYLCLCISMFKDKFCQRNFLYKHLESVFFAGDQHWSYLGRLATY